MSENEDIPRKTRPSRAVLMTRPTGYFTAMYTRRVAINLLVPVEEHR